MSKRDKTHHEQRRRDLEGRGRRIKSFDGVGGGCCSRPVFLTFVDVG